MGKYNQMPAHAAIVAAYKQKIMEINSDSVPLTHEYNEAEAARFRPEYERQLITHFIEWMKDNDYSVWGMEPDNLYKMYVDK